MDSSSETMSEAMSEAMSEETVSRELCLRERLEALNARQTRVLKRLWKTSETMEPELEDQDEIQDILDYYKRAVDRLRDIQLRIRKTIWECRTLKNDAESEKEWDTDNSNLEKTIQERKKLQRVWEYQAANFEEFKKAAPGENSQGTGFKDVVGLLKRAEEDDTTYEEFKLEELESFLGKGMVKVILWKEVDSACEEMVKTYEMDPRYRGDGFFSHPDSEATRNVTEKVQCNLYIVRESHFPKFTVSDAEEILSLAHCYNTENEFFMISAVDDKISSVEDGTASVDVHIGSDEHEPPWWQAYNTCQRWDSA